MSAKRNSLMHAGGIIGIPSILVGVAWWSLWLLWPSLSAYEAQAGRTPSLRITFLPESLATAAENGSAFEAGPRQATDDETASSRALLRYWAEHSRYMEREDPAGKDPLPSGASQVPRATPASEHRPGRSATPVFTAPKARAMRLLSHLSAPLDDNGFVFPTDELAKFQSQSPWHITAYIDIGPEGRPQHVFLESGTDDKELNQLVIRALYQGHIARAGKRCEGRVTVSYSRQPL